MLFVSSTQVKEGMCVAEDVCDHSGRILIARGQRIGRTHLVGLNKFGIKSLFIDPINGEKPTAPTKTNLRLSCEAIFNAACRPGSGDEEESEALDANAVKSTVETLIKSLRGSQNTVVTLSGGGAEEDRLPQHAVNTAALAVAVGLDLGLSGDALRELGGAMLLHDLGITLLPAELMHRTGPPGYNDHRAFRKHPILGYEHVLRMGVLGPGAAKIVLAHHERLDGSGYPQGLKGDRLTLPMRIAAVVEAFCSLTSDRYGIAAVLPDEAIGWMLAGGQVDRRVVQALCTRVALYPVGVAVRLTTGETGTVAGTLPRFPRSPVVLVHIDSRGRTLPNPMIVDLTVESGRAIAGCAPTIPLLEQSRAPGAQRPAIDPALAGIG